MRKNLKGIIAAVILTAGIMGIMVSVVASENPVGVYSVSGEELTIYLADPITDTTDSTPETRGGSPPPQDTLPPPTPPWN